MNGKSDQQAAVELLQELGLKEYEARCFVALSRRPQGTAKEISETSEVPRTRVYDAIGVLETKGLVEVQHSNPKQFRAVTIDEAIETIRSEYEERTEALRNTLRKLEPADFADETEVNHEVWALSGTAAIESRVQKLIDGAEEEVSMVVGHESVLTEALLDRLGAAERRGVEVLVGTQDTASLERIETEAPAIETFVSVIDWLGHSTFPGDDTEIGRLLMIDRSTILVSSFTRGGDGSRHHEQAVFGHGFDNGLVAIVRRMIATGIRAEAADD